MIKSLFEFVIPDIWYYMSPSIMDGSEVCETSSYIQNEDFSDAAKAKFPLNGIPIPSSVQITRPQFINSDGNMGNDEIHISEQCMYFIGGTKEIPEVKDYPSVINIYNMQRLYEGQFPTDDIDHQSIIKKILIDSVTFEWYSNGFNGWYRPKNQNPTVIKFVGVELYFKDGKLIDKLFEVVTVNWEINGTSHSHSATHIEKMMRDQGMIGDLKWDAIDTIFPSESDEFLFRIQMK